MTGGASNSPRGLYRKIWVLALPTVAYNLIEMSLGLADLFMVRSYGEAATAALGLGRQITFLLDSTIFALSIGVVTLVSQGLGKGGTRHVERIVAQSIISIAALSALLGGIGALASRPILAALQASPDTVEYGVSYLRIYFASMVFLGVNSVAAAIFRAAKDPWVPLRVVVAMSAINIPLNYWLIHGGFGMPALDVRGAALGTLVARVLGSVAFLLLLLRGRDGAKLVIADALHVDGGVIRRIFRIGLPIAYAGVMRNGARLVFLSIAGFSALGVSMHAAVGLGLQIRLLSVLPALAFQVATATLVGDAIGRGRFDEAEHIGQRSIVLLGAIMLALCSIIALFAEPLARAFIVDAEAAALGARVLRWFAVGQFFSSISIAVQGTLTGAGDTKLVAWAMFVSQWLVLVPAAYILLVPFELDPLGPLLAWAFSPILTFGMLYRIFLSGKWKSIKV